MFLGIRDHSPFYCTLHLCCPVQGGVEWGHCYPCAPNSRTWVTNKLSQSFKQPIANCRGPEQGCVTMDTYVYLSMWPKYPPPPPRSQTEVSLGEGQYLSGQQRKTVDGIDWMSPSLLSQIFCFGTKKLLETLQEPLLFSNCFPSPFSGNPFLWPLYKVVSILFRLSTKLLWLGEHWSGKFLASLKEFRFPFP